MGGGGKAPHILNLITRRRWVVTFTFWLLYTGGKSHQYPLDGKLGGIQNWFGYGGKEKSFCLTKLSSLRHAHHWL